MSKSTILQAKNLTGSTINAGQVTYIAGYDQVSGVALIALADCRQMSTLPFAGMVQETAPSGPFIIQVKILGAVSGLDTSNFPTNTPVYVGYNGGLLYHAPSIDNPSYINDQIGVVLTSAEAPNGAIELLPLDINQALIASNVGTGAGVLASQIGDDLTFKSIVAGNANIEILDNGSTISILGLGIAGATDGYAFLTSSTNEFTGSVKVDSGLTANNVTDSALTPDYMVKAGASGILATATNTDSDVSSAVSLKHSRSHAITSASDHTSSATVNTILKADANGLPISSQWTETSLNNALDGYATTTWVDGYISAYSTTAQMDSYVGATLLPYSTTAQMDSYVGATLVPYSTTAQVDAYVSANAIPYTGALQDINFGARNVTMTGSLACDNLTVFGTTTTIDTANLNVEDNIIRLNVGAAAGFTGNTGIDMQVGSDGYAELHWNQTSKQWEISTASNVTPHSETFNPIAFYSGTPSTTNNDFASFSGTAGAIQDSGYNATSFVTPAQMDGYVGVSIAVETTRAELEETSLQSQITQVNAHRPLVLDGDEGLDGLPGAAATIQIGTTTTLSPAAPATVSNTGTQQNATLNFGIPQGITGATGTAATIAVGTTTTLAPGQSATVTNSGSSAAATFNFGVPQGATILVLDGEDGMDGFPGTSGLLGNGLASEYIPKVTASGQLTNSNWTEATLNIALDGYATSKYSSTPFSSATSINITHNLGKYPLCQVLDNHGFVFIPQSIQNIDTNNITVVFGATLAGSILLTIG